MYIFVSQLQKQRAKAKGSIPLTDSSKKIIAHDTVSLRPARSAKEGKDPPMVISVPKSIIHAMKLKTGESLRIYTDGKKIFIDRFEEAEV
jgi:hypothetical protein